MIRVNQSFAHGIRFFSTTSSVTDKVSKAVQQKFPLHPFSAGITPDNRLQVLRNYLAMSQAFPYIQAGSQKELIFAAMRENREVPEDVEKTSVVANFLCWDEVGGHHLMMTEGMAALPKTLNVEQNFHSHLLKKDLALLFQQPVTPDYSPVTVKYLKDLYWKLAARDPVARCAMMVGFEMHAYAMISALWQSVSTQFQVDKEKLEYFKIHVGGDDPGEKYHVQMTHSLIQDLVPQKEEIRFIQKVQDCYGLNVAWCQALIEITGKEGSRFVYGLGVLK